ncbi:hypothetical protein N7519_002006 [Penicillium mononematosum]|uniref:uncharacterized protein n=1 Tax=Penicillium mononematosum TaxID=268346 RepID=UPI0025491250|nr:uncharacterized protein N7519_002006 [Penicillium mononematosum]KAJ6187098.1 hypothetical protein N7519_002006 [Penicillium mononematosum]
MLFGLSQRRAREPLKPPSDLDYPLMDLSSLEGAPIVNPKFIVPPDTTTPRIRTQSRASIQHLFSKPLPPRPASTDGLAARPVHNRWQYKAGFGP